MKHYLFVLCMILFSCCNSNKKLAPIPIPPVNNSIQENNNSMNKPIDFSVNPPVIIYKTKKNYNDKVPVILNDEGTIITSYPGIKDIFYNGELAIPVILNEGFLLDNRGINKNVAFLNITYSEYSKLAVEPSIDKLMQIIIDKDPLIEMYNCGSLDQYKNIVAELNDIITNKQLHKFKKIL